MGQKMQPGDVVWIDFPGVVQTKRRPAVIRSSATYHATRPDLIVGLITSQIAKATAPTDWILRDWNAAGLRVESAFRAFLVTLPQTAIVSTIGALTTDDRTAVAKRVNLALELR
jgi:mRNA interferase MazF